MLKILLRPVYPLYEYILEKEVKGKDVPCDNGWKQKSRV
jgi:hypothetical protein